jgi:hypothetical protein
MKKSEEKGLRIHLLILVFLILFALFLILFTSNIYVSQSYQYYTGTYEQKEGQELELGRVVVENTGLLPSKVYLKELVACEEGADFSYQLYYRGGASRASSDPFLSSSGFSLELGPGELRKLSLYYPGLFVKRVEEKVEERVTLYLFEVPEDEEFYNYELCSELLYSEREPLTKITIER